MKNFILPNDFRSIATEEDLVVLSDDNFKIIKQCNKIAVDEAAGYLSTRYDVTKLFLDPVEYQSGTLYTIGTRLYVNELLGSPAIETGEVIHYVCIKNLISQSPAIQITNTEYFEERDSRDQKLLEVIMSISLFYIHKRLSPNNIPTFRVMSYDGNGSETLMSAIKWLGLIQLGKLFPYGWELLSEIGTNEIDVDGDGIADYIDDGANPANGIMYGNDMMREYLWYDEKYDKNIKTI
jgi:hypothetical protein